MNALTWTLHVIIALSKGSNRQQFQREGLTCTNMPACDLSLRTLSKEKHGLQHTHCWMPVLHRIFTIFFFYHDNNVPNPTLHHFLCPVFILYRSLFAFSRFHIAHLINPTPLINPTNRAINLYWASTGSPTAPLNPREPLERSIETSQKI